MILHFDPSINLGSIAIVVTLVIMAFGGMRRLGRIEQRLALLWGWFKQEHDLQENGDIQRSNQ